MRHVRQILLGQDAARSLNRFHSEILCGGSPFQKGLSPHSIFIVVPDQINFEMFHIPKLSFCRKMRFSAEPAPHCGALHSRAASEQLTFFKINCSGQLNRRADLQQRFRSSTLPASHTQSGQNSSGMPMAFQVLLSVQGQASTGEHRTTPIHADRLLQKCGNISPLCLLTFLHAPAAQS